MSIRLDTICEIIGAAIPSNFENIEVRGVASLEEAGPDEICFLSNPKYVRYLDSSRACAVIVSRETTLPSQYIALVVPDPYFAFLQLLELFNARTPLSVAEGIHPLAEIHPEADLGSGISIGAYAVIGAEVTIGDNSIIGPGTVILAGSRVGDDCLLYPKVTIMDGCTVGDRVILHSGVVIGSDGFGFAPHGDRYHKIPQIGTVRIGDDVEIGANSCVDRAAFGATSIGNGTKIDNLVQVAHNVIIGSHTVIASQVGISGSTTIGNWVRMGGQAGLQGHIKVGDKASLGGQAGVTKDVPPGETVSGYPAKNHMQAMRQEGALRNLPDLIKKVKAQEKKIEDLETILKQIQDTVITNLKRS
jgi:UDP-3-O-[3-hydroxymyristoyl] glucosamine N-acyltransferase